MSWLSGTPTFSNASPFRLGLESTPPAPWVSVLQMEVLGISGLSSCKLVPHMDLLSGHLSSLLCLSGELCPVLQTWVTPDLGALCPGGLGSWGFWEANWREDSCLPHSAVTSTCARRERQEPGS